MNADLGPSWTNEECGYNLLSEYQLLRYGISVLKVASKGGLQLYLQDIKGRKFPIDSAGSQFRIGAHTYLADGTFAEADFILDGGAFGHVLSAKDAAAMGGGRGTECVSVGSFSPGAREELVGGAAWFTNFRDEKGKWTAPATKLNAATAITSAEALLLKVADQTVNLRPGESSSDEKSAEELLLEAADKAMRSNPDETTPEVCPLTMESEPSVPPSGVLLKYTKSGRGSTMKRDKSFLDRQAAERSRVTMETFGMSTTHYNQCVKDGVFEGHNIVAEEDPVQKMEKQMTGGKKSPRARSASTLQKKARVERELFLIVYCDGFEGAVGGAAESYTRHQYILRFVCGAAGYQKSFSCLTKDRFVDAFKMFQAWVLAMAPIIEAHRDLPKGYIRCRILASDRDSNFTSISGATRNAFDEAALRAEVLRYFADKSDSITCGAVESSFGPSARGMEQALLRWGMPDKHALHAWVDHEDKHNTLPSSANKLGNGEAPAATCGFEIDHSKFKPFGCVGTVNVLYKNLVADNDGNISVAKDIGSTGEGAVQRRGKIRRVRSLPCM